MVKRGVVKRPLFQKKAFHDMLEGREKKSCEL